MVSFMSRHQKASLFPGFYTLFFLFGGSHSWLSLSIGLEHFNDTSSHAPAPKPSEIRVSDSLTPPEGFSWAATIENYCFLTQDPVICEKRPYSPSWQICNMLITSCSFFFFFLTSLFIYFLLPLLKENTGTSPVKQELCLVYSLCIPTSQNSI